MKNPKLILIVIVICLLFLNGRNLYLQNIIPEPLLTIISISVVVIGALVILLDMFMMLGIIKVKKS